MKRWHEDLLATIKVVVLAEVVFFAGCGGGGSQTSCGAGTLLQNGACVANCGAGSHLDAAVHACVADVTCGPGTSASGGQCVPSGSAMCAPGTHLVGLQCAPNDTCGAGTHDSNGMCISDSGQSVCGAGTHLDAASNSCLPDVTCGPNTTASGGMCVVGLGGAGSTVWSPNVQLSSTIAGDGTPLVAYEPQIAVAQAAAAGPVDVYVAYPTFHGTGQSDVIVAISHDGGQTFPLEYTEASTNAVFGSPDHIGDSAIVAGHSTVALAFINYQTTGCAPAQGTCGSLIVDLSNDRGQTWTGPQPLVTTPYFVDRPFWSLGLDGYLYLSFTWVSPNGLGGFALDTRIIRVDSAGNTVLFSHGLGGFLSQAPIVATRQGTLFGTMDVNLPAIGLQSVAIVTAADNDSTPFILVTGRNSDESRANDFRNLNQSLAISPAGEMLLAWRFNIGGSTKVASTVTAGGVWPSGSLTGNLIDDAPLAVNAAYPVVTADENGRWHALWQDNRYGEWATFSSASSDGITWSPSSFVSDTFYTESGTYDPSTGRAKAFLGDYNSIAAAGGTLFAAWVDTRNSVSQVFFATAPTP